MRLTFAATLIAGAVAFGSSVEAQQLDKKEFNVIGTWNFLTPWQVIEKPFWTEELAKLSGGRLTANIKSVTEVNLKGTEVLRLTKQGVFDFAGMVGIYVDDGAAVIEGADVSGVSRTFKMNREIADAWMPEMQQVMKEKHGAIILAHTTWPEQNFYCRGEIKDINDLKGKKIRVQGTSQADLVAALGGTGVTIAFGEVVPALEKGVVDCGITGTMPAYKAKWPEVTNTLYRLPVGFTVGMWVANLAMWNKLPPATREFMEKQMKEFQERTWKTVMAESEEGVACTTGIGTCTVGPPGKLKLVIPSEADLKARDKALNEQVLKAWAKRCGEACAAKWNELIGKKYGLVANAGS